MTTQSAKPGFSNVPLQSTLLGKHVLFVGPRFFGYEKDILHEIAGRGAIVDWLPDRPFDTPLMAAITRFRKELLMPAIAKLYRQKLAEFGRRRYDIIFVLNGQTMPRDILVGLRSDFPEARFILYMWDSIENRSSIARNLDLFDECSSFDPGAVDRFGMALRPLFFSTAFQKEPQSEFQHHLSFVGTAHTDRYKIVNAVDNDLHSRISRYWYLYIQAKWVYRSYKLTNPHFSDASISAFRFEPLPRAHLLDIFQKSLAILDIEHPLQTGLTMRTFETLGSSKKLVTTNPCVRDYDFYNPQNVHIIDRAKPTIPVSFFGTPYAPVPYEIYRRYSLAGWLDDLLERKSP